MAGLVALPAARGVGGHPTASGCGQSWLESVIQLSAEAWEYVCATGEQAVLLDLAETDGMGAVCAWLDARGLGCGSAGRGNMAGHARAK